MASSKKKTPAPYEAGTQPLYGLKAQISPSTSYRGERPFPPSYLASAVHLVLGTPDESRLRGLTRDQWLAEDLGLSQAAFSSYKRGASLMPFDIAVKLQQTAASVGRHWGDEAVLTWYEADVKLREEWRAMGQKVAGIKAAASRRARRMERRSQPKEAAPAVAVVETKSVTAKQITPIVTTQQINYNQRAEVWIREVFGVSGDLRKATQTTRITHIDFERLRGALVALLEEIA